MLEFAMDFVEQLKQFGLGLEMESENKTESGRKIKVHPCVSSP